MYALVHNNEVVQLVDNQEDTFECHGGEWFPVDGIEVGEGWKFNPDNTTFYSEDVEPPEPKIAREIEYPHKDELIVALWEMVVEGRDASAKELQALREQVKAANPLNPEPPEEYHAEVFET